MINFFKKIFRVAMRAVKKFLKIALPKLLKIIFSELQEFAIESIEDVQFLEISNEEKRKEVFTRIKKQAEIMHIDISTSAINLLIELAVQYLKQRKK